MLHASDTAVGALLFLTLWADPSAAIAGLAECCRLLLLSPAAPCHSQRCRPACQASSAWAHSAQGKCLAHPSGILQCCSRQMDPPPPPPFQHAGAAPLTKRFRCFFGPRAILPATAWQQGGVKVLLPCLRLPSLGATGWAGVCPQPLWMHRALPRRFGPSPCCPTPGWHAIGRRQVAAGPLVQSRGMCTPAGGHSKTAGACCPLAPTMQEHAAPGSPAVAADSASTRQGFGKDRPRRWAALRAPPGEPSVATPARRDTQAG